MSILLRSPLVRSRLLDMGMAAAAGGYSTEAQQFFDRITDPGDTRKGYLATLIDGLVADGLWSKLDALWLFAQDISGNAVVNLKSSSFTASLVNSPTFTADEGYTGNGSTSYLSSNFVPSTAGGNYGQNSASIGAYLRTSRTTNGGMQSLGVATTINMNPLWTDGLYYWVANGASKSLSSPGNVQGMHVISRTASNAMELYKNGASVDTSANGSASLASIAVYMAARNNAGSADRHSTDQMAAAFIGGALDDTEAANISGRINTYMTSLGKNVY